MKTSTKAAPRFIRTSISLPPETLRMGRRRAESASRTFSNYVSILIQSDKLSALLSK